MDEPIDIGMVIDDQGVETTLFKNEEFRGTKISRL